MLDKADAPGRRQGGVRPPDAGRDRVDDALADEVTGSLRRALAAVEGAIGQAETTLPALQRLAATPSATGTHFGRSAAGMLQEAEERLERLHQSRMRVLGRLEEWEATRARGEYS